MKYNQSRPGFELVSQCPFPTAKTITPRAAPFFLPTIPLGKDMIQGQFFKRSLTGFNTEFSFSLTNCYTKAEEPSQPYYLPIAGERIITPQAHISIYIERERERERECVCLLFFPCVNRSLCMLRSMFYTVSFWYSFFVKRHINLWIFINAKAKKNSSGTIQRIAGRIRGFIPFPRVFVCNKR